MPLASRMQYFSPRKNDCLSQSCKVSPEAKLRYRFLQVFNHKHTHARTYQRSQVLFKPRSHCVSTYCAIDAGQQLAIELHHRIDSSFHLLLSHSLKLTCRRKA